MKKIMILLVVMLFAYTGLRAQQLTLANKSGRNTQSPAISLTSFTNDDPVVNKDYDYYMKKSRNNRTASWCLVGGGFVIAGIGALTFPKDYDMIFENSSEKESKADAATALIVVGAAAMLSSIPFTIMSGVHKRKAKLMMDSKNTGFGVPPGVSTSITSLTMTIAIGK